MAAAAPRSMKITLAISDVPQRRGIGARLRADAARSDNGAGRGEGDAEVRLGEQAAACCCARRLESGAFFESPKPGDAAFAHSHFVLLLGEHDLLHAAHRACEAQGCPMRLRRRHRQLAGRARCRLSDWVAVAQARRRQDLADPRRPVAVLCDGELSSPVTGDGVGGRNSAFVLACVPKIAGKRIAVLSAGTDGIDGNSPAAGAVADGETLARASAAGMDPKDFQLRSDAYHFFERLGDAVVTGPTGHNLRDLRILLAR